MSSNTSNSCEGCEGGCKKDEHKSHQDEYNMTDVLEGCPADTEYQGKSKMCEGTTEIFDVFNVCKGVLVKRFANNLVSQNKLRRRMNN